MKTFADRQAAGEELAEQVEEALAAAGRKEAEDSLVLALPRGGVPVAGPVADRLGCPLDILSVRKLGVPWHPELAMGAIASGGVTLMNDEVLAHLRISPEQVEQVRVEEQRRLESRERLFRGDRPYPDLTGKTVIIVDDGAATGSTMGAALRAARRLGPARLLAALPVAAPEVVRRLEAEADQVVCLLTPQDLVAVGRWYQVFGQTDDTEVQEILKAHR